MFYAIRCDLWGQIGGFDGLEHVLADDFAVAQRIRAHGYRLIQTPLRHAISTQVTSARHYFSLMQRWFIFPRESLLRHLGGRDRLVLLGLGLLPTFFPLLALAALITRPGRRTATYALAYLGYSFAIFAHINRAYLGGAAPWRRAWWVPVLEAAFPIQLLAALLAPQRIVWRGHVIQAETGGGLRLVRRRSPAPQE
jgi:ceramide glucosyltransferase